MVNSLARNGMILPKQTAVDILTKATSKFYLENILNLERKLHQERMGATDSIFDLMAYIRGLIDNNSDKPKELHTDVMLWGALGVVGLLALRRALEKQFDSNYEYFLKKYIDSAQKKTSMTAIASTGDVKFQEDVVRLRDLYIKEIENKVLVENNNIQKKYLYDLVQDGKVNKNTLIRNEKNGVERFYKNELLLFNKDMNVRMLIKSDYDMVEWRTMRDEKVRPSHRKLDGEVFNIYGIPEEAQDWGCRCVLIGVENK